MQWREGHDGQEQRYRERLFPGWWVWLAVAGFVAMIAIAYGYAFGVGAGWLVAAAGAVLAIGLLLSTRLNVHVDDRVLRVGRARLPLRWVGRAVPLDAELSREARSTRLDPRAHLALRTSRCATSVMVEVTDPDDPHPYWLFSTKDPDKLVSVLREAVQLDEARRSRGARHNAGNEEKT